MPGFDVIPAVDIRNGRCVRLYRGRPEEETVFFDDPAEVAARWEREGAALVHVVDLDGAFGGRPVNFGVIVNIIKRLSVPVQVGGGIRDTESAFAYIDSGAARVIIGTAAFTGTSLLEELTRSLGDRLAVGVDAREGLVATGGWLDTSDTTACDAVERLAALGVRRVIYTDINRDGTLSGPNFDGIETIAGISTIPVIASGGVSGIDDIRRIHQMSRLGVEGVIVGMALYRGEFTLEEANRAVSTKGEW